MENKKKVRPEFQEPEPVKKPRICQACNEGQLNQIGHYGGCLPDPTLGETWETFEK